MKHNKLHITIYFLLIWSFSFAQQYTNYATKDGLPSNHVYTIMQDAKGFMWFLTDKGMVRYNGKTFKTFTTKQGLPNNDVWDAFPTPDGKIWYMSKSTHLGYIENDSVLSFPNENEEETINPIYSIQLNNEVYPAGPKKIYALKDKVWRSFKNTEENGIQEDYTTIFNDKVAYLGVNLEDESLNIYDKQNHILSKSSTKGMINQNSSRGQISDSLYFWVSEKSYSILNLKSFDLNSFNYSDEIGIETIKYPRINLVGNSIQISGDQFVGTFNKDFHIENPFFFPQEFNAHFGFIDQQNTIWLATFTNGVYKLPYIKQNIVYHFNNEKIQNLNLVNNELFASVYNKGFFKYNETDKTFDSYIASHDYNSGAVYIDSLKRTYFLKQSGIISEGGGKREVINFNGNAKPSLQINSYVKKLTLFKYNLYGIYSFGIFKLDAKTFNIEKDIILKGSNDFLVFNSRLIIATNNGLKELENDSIKKIEFDNGIFNKPILSIKALSESDILINTDGFGSYISDLDTIKPLENSEFLIVQDAFIQEKAIWLATNSGVLHYTKINKEYKLIRAYTINDGLPNNNINTIYVNNKDIIVGTNNGLAIVPINQSVEDQLIDVFISSATYNKQLFTEDNMMFDYAKNNAVNFKFESVDYSESDTENEDYGYKLKPLQTHWINTTNNTVNFNNLQPGNYVFEVYNKSISKKISFKIKALWWQTFWFKMIIILLGVFVVALVSIMFVRRSQFLKNQKIFEDKRLIELQLKALRSQMNPHFVFNSLAAIQYYINENDFEASEKYLVKFSKLIRQFFELSKETEISLAAEIHLLQSYLEIEKLRFKEKLAFTIHVDPDLYTNSTKVPTMILQPIIENAINHGIFNKEDNGNVTVNFIKGDRQTVIVEIIDDGVGFVNTIKRDTESIKSSSVLNDRLRYLNNSKRWYITYAREELYPDKYEKGNKSIFEIQEL